MSRHADGKTYLETECLAVTPMPFDQVNGIYGMSFSDVPKHIVDKLCLSHERLRAELLGAEEIIKHTDEKSTIDTVVVCACCMSRSDEVCSRCNLRVCRLCLSEVDGQSACVCCVDSEYRQSAGGRY